MKAMRTYRVSEGQTDLFDVRAHTLVVDSGVVIFLDKGSGETRQVVVFMLKPDMIIRDITDGFVPVQQYSRS